MPNQTSILRRRSLEMLSSPPNVLHQTIAQKGWGSTCVYEPLLLEMCRWEIGKGIFPEHRGNGAPVPSWGWFTCWTRKLPNAWGLSFWISNLTLIVLTGYVLLFRDMKKDFSCSLRVLCTGEHVWSAFWGMDNPCIEPRIRAQEAAHWNFSGNCWSLVRK